MNKKTTMASLAALLLFASACAPAVKPDTTPAPTAEITAAPTDAPTEKPTDAPTAAPTDAPTDAPTAAPGPQERPTLPPDFSGDTPAFPGAVRLGNLIGGELFPESAKYFVLDGESDLHYVYDRFGTLVTTFNRTEYEYTDWDGEGFYGEHGAPYGYSIERGENLPEYQRLGDIMIQTEYWEYINEEGETRGNVFITDIRKIDLEPSPLMNAAPEYTFLRTEYTENGMEQERLVRRAFKVDYAGAIVKIDGKYLILDRTINYGAETPWLSLTTHSAMLVSESGEVLSQFDTAPFGRICGVFGGKYIIGTQALEEPEQRIDGGISYERINLYTLSGELVMERVLPLYYQGYHPEHEMYITTGYADHLQASDGNYYNAEFERIDKPSAAERHGGERADIYGALHIEDRAVAHSELYVGIKDGEGNWLFRIYKPGFASDSENPELWW